MAGLASSTCRLYLRLHSPTPISGVVPASTRLFSTARTFSALSTRFWIPSGASPPSRPSRTRPFSTTNQALRPPNMVAQDFEAVLKGKYPAKAHAERVTKLIRDKIAEANGVLYLESRHTKLLEDNDSAEPFRQRRYFYYLTGCNLPDSHFIYDIANSRSTLFIPDVDPDDVIWSGEPITPAEAKEIYDVDEVKYVSHLNPELVKLGKASSKSTVFAIQGQVSEGVTFIEFENKDFEALKPAIEVARVVKDEYEVAMMRKANHISGIAHEAVMAKAKSATNERELEAAFFERCMFLGAREMAYYPIVAGGRAPSTLHYVKNNAPLEGKLNLLIDAGAEYGNYAADITRTFPLSGKFTKESRGIYDIVLKMQKDCMSMLKAGVQWEDVHITAHKIAIHGLVELGILKGDETEILESKTSAAFFPHGLGHYLGLDTHDTGGNPNYKDKDILFKYLRLRGKLPVGGVVTVEPGIYFCRFIIEPYLKDPKHSKYIDSAVLDKYWDVGGVRIEDNLLITETGYENLTNVEKEPERLEALIASG